MLTALSFLIAVTALLLAALALTQTPEPAAAPVVYVTAAPSPPVALVPEDRPSPSVQPGLYRATGEEREAAAKRREEALLGDPHRHR